MNAALKCIQNLENAINAKEIIYKQQMGKNTKLRTELSSKSGKPMTIEDMPRPLHTLYTCDACGFVPSSIRSAFSHQDLCIKKYRSDLEASTKIRTISTWGRGGTDCGQKLLRCRHCAAETADQTLLHLHSLLHRELTYFQCPWPRCQMVFGLPSKLKTHHFLCHEMVLAAEEKCVINMELRVEITRFYNYY